MAKLHYPQKNQVEAGGIEPPSRDNSNGGLYMLIWCFNLDPRGGHQHSPQASSRLVLADGSTTESIPYPAFCGQPDAGFRLYRGYLIIRQPYEPGRQSRLGLQQCCWQLRICSIFYEANERPRHATATVAIRSKPIAPGSRVHPLLRRHHTRVCWSAQFPTGSVSRPDDDGDSDRPTSYLSRHETDRSDFPRCRHH